MEKLAQLAEQNHYKILNAHMDDMTSIHSSIRAIGAALDCTDKAEALLNKIDADLDAIRAALKDKPRLKVLLINTRQSHDLNNIFTVGKRSFMSELTTIAGGENIFNDTEKPLLETSRKAS